MHAPRRLALDVFKRADLDRDVAAARRDGIPEDWIAAAQASPVYRLAKVYRVALPLHPEYRTMPMVWYVPPLSPIQSAASMGAIEHDGVMPDVRSLRIPVKYLANMLTAGEETPIITALERMLAMRSFMRSKSIDGVIDHAVAERVGLAAAQIEDMYQIMAIANYEDRFVIPTTHREYAENAFNVRGGCGFSFGNGCSEGVTETSLFGSEKKRTIPIKAGV